MITRRKIREYATEIAREFRPRRIILFGSYAYGKPTRDSDVDLLVIMPHRGRGVEKAIEIRLKLDAPFPMDLLVRSPQKIRQRLAWGDCFIQEIMEKGAVLCEARHVRPETTEILRQVPQFCGIPSHDGTQDDDFRKGDSEKQASLGARIGVE